jgi:hypothetical protein
MSEKEILLSIRKLFTYYKGLGEKSIQQINDQDINWRPNPSCNSISLIVHHLSGNMLSRFTDFLTTDGEKEWRNRDAEFEVGYFTKAEMMEAWEQGWSKLFQAMDSLLDEDLRKTVYIRNEGHAVLDALQRQLAHYPYHVGQIVFIAKQLKGDAFNSLSIPLGGSKSFNSDKFSQEKSVRHFTDKA